MAKLTDRQHKRMIAMYAECQNYSLVAREFGVSASTVRRHINGDAETAEKVQRKKEENTIAVLAHMSRQKDKICGLLDRLITSIDDPHKMDGATLPQLATTLGILIDKYTADEARTAGLPQDNNLLHAIAQSTQKELDTDDIPEIKQAAVVGADVVE